MDTFYQDKKKEKFLHINILLLAQHKNEKYGVL